MYQKLNIY